MNKKAVFSEIDKDIEDIVKDLGDEEFNSDTFVSGLPDWDLEPPYESIDRGDS